MIRQRIRIRFSKCGAVRFISHLDLMRAFERALRRAGLPLRMTEGFNPRPKMSFPLPLSVGIEGLDEVMEFELADWRPPAAIEESLRGQFPKGVALKSLALIAPASKARVAEIIYEVTPICEDREGNRVSDETIQALLGRRELIVKDAVSDTATPISKMARGRIRRRPKFDADELQATLP